MWPRFLSYLGVHEHWRRPLPERWWRTDVLVALAAFGLAVTLLQLTAAITPRPIEQPLWQQWTFLAVTSSTLVIRRRWPALTAVLACGVLFLGGSWFPVLGGQLSTQVLVFVALYSALAWGRDRQLIVGVVVFVHLCLLLWVVWAFAVQSGVQRWMEATEQPAAPSDLPLGMPVLLVAYTLLINLLYVDGALVVGNHAWWSARRAALLSAQKAQMEAQSEQMARQAVNSERLRIARELHDVVAHHVAAIGVQAGAARRVLERKDAAAAKVPVATALQQVEESSRNAVTEMRALLGTLRDAAAEEGTLEESAAVAPAAVAATATAATVSAAATAADRGQADATRAPASGPGVDGLEQLVEQARATGLQVSFDEALDPALPRAQIPTGASASLYRVAQEALSNVRAHSTATAARLTLRTGRGRFDGAAAPVPFAEIEVVDDGRPRQGTSGTGMGQLGMRERARSHGGFVDIGPRPVGGYRVRIRLPLPLEA